MVGCSCDETTNNPTNPTTTNFFSHCPPLCVPFKSTTILTKYGGLRGSIVTLPNKNLQPVEVFLGIPYASPPTGKLRFMPPVTPAIWSGTRSAHTLGSVCPQKLINISNETESLKTMTGGRLSILKRLLPTLHNQSEDCLYLNIFAPANVILELSFPIILELSFPIYDYSSLPELIGFLQILIQTLK
ncbi:unnamed protein product, partial [Oppiella nova]